MWRWLLIIGWTLVTTANAQVAEEKNSFFDANCLNILENGHNSLIEINFNPSLFHIDLGTGNAMASLEIKLAVRKRNSRNFILTRHFRETIEHRFLMDENVFFRRYGLTLPAGSYSVEIEVKDLQTGKIHFAAIEYVCKDLEKGYQLSDIVLEQDFLGALGAQTLLTGRISPHPGRLRFRLEAYGPAGPALTARAVLYRKKGNESGDIARFAAVEQMVRILKPTGKPITFGDTIGLNELESGEYLLEIYLEQGNALIAEESRPFTVSWKTEGRVFGNLDVSIEMMRYIAPQSWIAALLKAPSEEEKIERFQKYWEARKENPAAGETRTLENFYGRAFFAEDNFAEDSLSGWQTDRGGIYITYGPPARIDILKNKTPELLVWEYDNPPLRFVFRKNGQRWNQLKP